VFPKKKEEKERREEEKEKKKQTQGRDCQHCVATMYFSQSPKPKPFRIHFLNVCL